MSLTYHLSRRTQDPYVGGRGSPHVGRDDVEEADLVGEATTGERVRVDAPGVVSWPRQSGTRRVPALDGVRAVAVIAVLGFHGGLSWPGVGSSAWTRSSCYRAT